MLKGFQQFIVRGNVLDLAVAVVMGAAFGEGRRHRSGQRPAHTADCGHRWPARFFGDCL